jgi:predicted amidohydrolase YtcJ
MPLSSFQPQLILTNARVLTLNPRQPVAEAVAIKGERIAWVGSNEEVRGLGWRGAKLIDCQGHTLVPGMIDAHCHLLAYASSLLAVDCSPSSVRSIVDIKEAIRRRAAQTPPGQWIRASGYSEFDLEERRHLTRWDLDEAAPNHLVRLNHRSGHACVLNSMALSRVGISMDTDEPPGGTIERDLNFGQPTGLLLEMNDLLEDRIPPLTNEELRQGVEMANQRFLSFGITSIQDATSTNSIERWEVFRRLKEAGILAPRATIMAGANHLGGFLESKLGFGSGNSHLNVGHLKIMLTTSGGSLFPSESELEAIIRRAHAAGFPAAIHAVEAEAVEAAVNALGRVGHAPSLRDRDRIEHCSECPPHALDRLASLGAVLVTQSGFIYSSGRRYLEEVSPEVQPWLYRIRSFQDAGLTVAASSDAPVIDPNPFTGMYAAVTRRAASGEVVGEQEKISAMEALKMYTLNAAYAASQQAEKGLIEVGKLADMSLLSHDPTEVEPEQLRNISAVMTIIGGKVVYSNFGPAAQRDA